MSAGTTVADLLDRLEGAAGLDPLGERVQRLLRPLLADRRVADVLHGVPIGHALHPGLAQLSLGFFAGAGLLDLLGQDDDRRSARVLVSAGLASSAPTIASGWADWSHGHEQQQRTGLVHAAANAGALTLLAASLASRRRGRVSRATSLAGLAVLTASAFLGGHLAYRQAMGVNHSEHVPHLVPPGWHDLCRESDIPPAGPTRQMLGDQPLLVARDGGTIRVLSDVCSHLAGPLTDGDIADGCVECPWHGSRFRLADGSVAAGPATAPAPAFEVRITDGGVQVRLPNAG